MPRVHSEDIRATGPVKIVLWKETSLNYWANAKRNVEKLFGGIGKKDV